MQQSPNPRCLLFLFNMRARALFYFAFLVLLSSCASLFNSPTHVVAIRTHPSVEKIVVNKNVYNLHDGEVKVHVQRGNDPLIIGFPGNDSFRRIAIQPRNSFIYLAGAASTAGLTTIVERKDPKRWAYQKNIYIEQVGNKITVHRFGPIPKGTIQVELSMPYMNYMYVKSVTGMSHCFGFFGLGAGINYFYRDNRFFSLSGGVAADLPIPVPAPVDYVGGVQEQASSVFISARHNHMYRSFEFGYGFNFSRFEWTLYDHSTVPAISNQHMTTDALGLSLVARYRATKNFRVGILYQPTLSKSNTDPGVGYQHLLSLEMAVKLRLR
jgi:hypothetical protein